MPAYPQRHALAAAVALGSAAALTAVVAASGFRDFGSAFWLINVASVAALAYALTVLAARAVAREPGVWKRASAFGAAAGGVLAMLAFVRVAELSAAGVGVAVVLTGALGAALGLAATEGVRWVQGSSRPAGRAV